MDIVARIPAKVSTLILSNLADWRIFFEKCWGCDSFDDNFVDKSLSFEYSFLNAIVDAGSAFFGNNLACKFMSRS